MRLLRVATFNIQHGRGPDGRVEPARLGAACARLDADVLGLQEVEVGAARSHGVDLLAVVAEAAAMHATFGFATTTPDGGRYGNGLLSRERLSDVEVVKLPGRRETRCVLLARTFGVSVAVTHLSVGTDQHLAQLDAALAALNERSAPRLLMGDFNHEAPSLPGFTLAAGEPTWPAGRPSARIDHIATDGLAIEAVDVLHLDVSDHRAVVATVRGP
jgi:endonuclease/exonuclease/phosphatase family metal-dependent hydrolase